MTHVLALSMPNVNRIPVSFFQKPHQTYTAVNKSYASSILNNPILESLPNITTKVAKGQQHNFKRHLNKDNVNTYNVMVNTLNFVKNDMGY